MERKRIFGPVGLARTVTTLHTFGSEKNQNDKDLSKLQLMQGTIPKSIPDKRKAWDTENLTNCRNTSFCKFRFTFSAPEQYRGPNSSAFHEMLLVVDRFRSIYPQSSVHDVPCHVCNMSHRHEEIFPPTRLEIHLHVWARSRTALRPEHNAKKIRSRAAVKVSEILGFANNQAHIRPGTSNVDGDRQHRLWEEIFFIHNLDKILSKNGNLSRSMENIPKRSPHLPLNVPKYAAPNLGAEMRLEKS